MHPDYPARSSEPEKAISAWSWEGVGHLETAGLGTGLGVAIFAARGSADAVLFRWGEMNLRLIED